MKSLLTELGWREWVALPEFGIDCLKAKVDTGARTSALHAFFAEAFEDRGVHKVRFGLHPEQNNVDMEKICEAELLDERNVTDSGGHTELRFVIKTPVIIGSSCFDIEMTLTKRDNMKFRMLLGRTALNDVFTVNPARSYLAGKPDVK